MKKLGKKIHSCQETIEAYACGCGCGCACSQACNYSTDCGSLTTVMVSLMQGTYSRNYYGTYSKAENDGLASGSAM